MAAGSGSRLAADRPKAFVLLAGATLLEHAVRRVAGSGAVGSVVLVVPAALVGQAQALDEVVRAGDLLPGGVVVVPGGPDRTSSVRCGLTALPDRVGTVLVHDAARCLVPGDLVRRVAEAVPSWRAVVPGLPLADTVKQVDAAGTVVATPDRALLRAVQTPQGFARDLLERAHRAHRPDAGPADGATEATPATQATGATDDAALVERLGEPVHLVPGDPRALKITTADDLAHAAWLLAAEQAASSRPGG